MTQRTPIHDAVDLLRHLERRKAVALIRQYMDENREPGERWQSVARLCDQIGEIDLAVEASRRYALTEPVNIDRRLVYWSELVKRGRLSTCLTEFEQLPKEIFEDNIAVVHLRSIIATQQGDFDLAEPLIRKTIKHAKLTGQNWLSLAMIKKFKPGDKDLAEMEKLRPMFKDTPAASSVPFYYALGKAHHDTGDHDRAFETYSVGANIKRKEAAYNPEAREAFTQNLIENFTSANFSSFKPSSCHSERAIFVTGAPRSGTTLVEQILTSHSEVSGGAELNLFRASLLPCGDFSYIGAAAYEERESENPDPWGDIGRDYIAMLEARFGPDGRIVDKTLNHSRFMGLLLHILPDAKVVWMRRNPEDTAISAFRNFFASPIRWSWSLADAGHYFRMEDALHAHWARVFPDQILTVPYEQLVAAPREWIAKILNHTGLPEEEAVFEPHKQKKRSVMTASVAQVREPISAKQVGSANAYEKYMHQFREAYKGATT